MADIIRSIILRLQAVGAGQVKNELNSAASSALTLEKKITGATTSISGEMKKASRSVNIAGREMERSFSKTASASNFLRNSIVSLGGLFGGREIFYYADAYTSLHNRIAIVSKSSDELYTASKRLFEIAQKTRSGWVQTAEVYSRTAQATRRLGASHEEALQFTEMLNKAVAVSGSTSIEAENAVRQLMQALGSGMLRGDELRSVVEQLIYVANLISEGMGLKADIGDLRKLAEKGKVTAEEIWLAFFKMMKKIDSDFGKLEAPMTAHFAKVKNAILKSVGEIDDKLGASKGVVTFFDFLATHMEKIVAFGGVLAATGLVKGLGTIYRWLVAILTKGHAVLAVIGLLFTFSDKIEPKRITDWFKEGDEERLKRLRNELNKLYEAKERAQRSGTLTDIGEGFLKLDIKRIEAEISAVKQRLQKEFSDAIRKDPKNFKIDLTFDAGWKIDKLKKEYASLYDMGISALGVVKDFFVNPTQAFRSGRLQEVLDDKSRKIREEEDRLKKGQKELEEKMEKPTGAALDLGLKGTAPPSFAEIIKDLERESVLLKLNNEQRLVAVELYRIEETIKRKLTDAERLRVASILLADEAFQKEKSVLEEIKEPQRELVEKTGILNKLLAEGKISTDEYTEALGKLGEESKKVANTFAGGFADALTTFKGRLEEFGSGFSKWITDSFDRATDTIVEFAKTGTLTIDKFLSDIAESMLRFATQQLVSNMMTSLFGGLIGPGAALVGASGAVPAAGGMDSSPAGILSSLSGLFGSSRGGGRDSRLTGAPAPTPAVPAPRMGGGDYSGGISIVNIIDPKESLAAINTAAGSKVIMNTIQRNPAELRKILGAN